MSLLHTLLKKNNENKEQFVFLENESWEGKGEE